MEHQPHSRPRDRVPARPERELATLATRQHGVVSRSDLLGLGFKVGAIRRRREAGSLHPLHRGVYAVGHRRITRYGRWMAAVLACGKGAVLSHHSAAALWGLLGVRAGPIDVTSAQGRPGRAGIVLHRGRIHPEERSESAGIPVTSVARTLFDLGEVLDEDSLRRAFEEADRLSLLGTPALERVCARAHGRHGLAPTQRLIAASLAPTFTRSCLEDRFAALCREHRLPPPSHNVVVLGREVDALWPKQRLVVELDGFAFHHHRAAFERDRARDAALQAAGYRVIRLTWRRLEREPAAVAAQIGSLLRTRA